MEQYTFRNLLHKILASQNRFLRAVSRLAGFLVRIAEMSLLWLFKDKNLVNLIRQVQSEKRILMRPLDMAQVYTCALAAAKLPGEFAEVGVYKGGSAKLISEAKGDKHLHLFDTFEGLPNLQPIDGKVLHEKQFAVSLDKVKKYLQGYKNITFYPGLFSQTAQNLKDKRFAFVHIDPDLYESTASALKFFYPRLNQGGMILCHDYPHLPGVKKAVDEFFADKNETVIELSLSQCLVVKI